MIRDEGQQHLDLLVTLPPSFPHFREFAIDPLIAGVRLNIAGLPLEDVKRELAMADEIPGTAPRYFDAKGRQLRVVEVVSSTEYLDIRLNHRIRLHTVGRTIPVLFKGGADCAGLVRLEEDGQRLIFCDLPMFEVRTGDSLCIRDPSLRVLGPLFTDVEVEKIGAARRAGMNRFFLSYVEEARDVDTFHDIVGRDTEVLLKIESERGMKFVTDEFRGVKESYPETYLVAARGDLFVEIREPDKIVDATRIIIAADPDAIVGSRILLSVAQPSFAEMKLVLSELSNGKTVDPLRADGLLDYLTRPQVPSCADFSELAWLIDIGYRRFMLCDDVCLKPWLLRQAVAAFDAFRRSHFEL